MAETNRPRDFEQEVLPHLDAAYNLARWLTRNDQDAQDIVQEAYLRAFRFFDGFRGGEARAWLLKIVRNQYLRAKLDQLVWNHTASIVLVDGLCGRGFCFPLHTADTCALRPGRHLTRKG